MLLNTFSWLSVWTLNECCKVLIKQDIQFNSFQFQLLTIMLMSFIYWFYDLEIDNLCFNYFMFYQNKIVVGDIVSW